MFLIRVVPFSIKPRLLAVMGISFSQSNACFVSDFSPSVKCMVFCHHALLVLRTFLLILGASKSYDQIISSESSSYFPRSEKTWLFSTDSGQPIPLLVLMSLLKVLTITFISFHQYLLPSFLAKWSFKSLSPFYQQLANSRPLAYNSVNFRTEWNYCLCFAFVLHFFSYHLSIQQTFHWTLNYDRHY